MKPSFRYVATFAAGLITGVSLCYLVIAKRPAPQPLVSVPSVVPTQFDAGGPLLAATQSMPSLVITQIDLRQLEQASPGIVGNGFLFDGVLLRDLQRMNRVPPDSRPVLGNDCAVNNALEGWFSYF